MRRLVARFSVLMNIDDFFPVIHFECNLIPNLELPEYLAFRHQVIRLFAFQSTQYHLRRTIIDRDEHPSDEARSLPGMSFWMRINVYIAFVDRRR